jgi:hypothetical protein
MQIAHVLGNMKPSHLRQVERSAWQLLLRIGKGSTARLETPAFLLEFDAMLLAWSSDVQNPPAYDFFQLRTSPISVAISSNLILQLTMISSRHPLRSRSAITVMSHMNPPESQVFRLQFPAIPMCPILTTLLNLSLCFQ